MAKDKGNGNGLVPRYLTESEIAHKGSRIAKLLKEKEEIPKKKKALDDEIHTLQVELNEKCEMVPHGELPLEKRAHS